MITRASSMLYGSGEASLLRQHLKAIVEVELLTIPLYLTATYSFTERALKYSPDGGKSRPLFDIQQSMLSVAVQEMYHLQLACNLCNAFDVTPDLPTLSLKAGEAIAVPHLQPDHKTLQLALGNARDLLPALIAIEQASDEALPEPNKAVVYPSIAALYHATVVLLNTYMRAFQHVEASEDPHFTPRNKQVVHATFASTYKHNRISKRTDVAHAINAITDQGEGKTVAARVGGLFQSAGPSQVLPEYQPKEGSRFARFGDRSHFQRFVEARSKLDEADWEKTLGGALFYENTAQISPDRPAWVADYTTLQDGFAKLWSYLLDTMRQGFGDGSLGRARADDQPDFGSVMLSFKYVTPMLWQSGHTPSYDYRPGVSGKSVQEAMDAVDRLCLFHWDRRTAEMRKTWNADGVDLNACQGLNDCAGKGWGGIATERGNGACATADPHTCGANNECKSSGGCGFLVAVSGEACNQFHGQLLPPSDEWNPGHNACHQQGGCQVPISPDQVFNRLAEGAIENQEEGLGWTSEAKKEMKDRVGKNVWDRARALLTERTAGAALPSPSAKIVEGIEYDGTKRRSAIMPTSR